MINYIKKSTNIIKNDGFNIFITRLLSYSQVRFKRLYKFKIKEEIERFASLNNKYKNKRVFLLGNGPSLNKTPLHLLENEYKMCCNRFNLFYDRINWKPDFYLATDDLLIKDIHVEINKDIIPEINACFFPDIHPSNLEIKNTLIKPKNNIFWINADRPGFTLDLPYCGINKTVINPGLQILSYLGFSEIYLLGMDLTFSNQNVKKHNSRNWTAQKNDDPNHFDPRYFGKGYSYHNPTEDEILETFEEAKLFFDNHRVNIYNSTIGGKLEVFSRVDLHSLFNLDAREELMLFLKQFSIYDYKSSDLTDYFDNSQKINSIEEWNENKNYVVCDTNIAITLIPKVIDNFIPYGPILGKYLFMKRKQ